MIRTLPRLSIHLMGTPEVSVAGIPLPVNHLKARALLFFLAATGKPHTRDFLATLLWSEVSSQDAHHSLRSSLYRLRQTMQPGHADEFLIVEGETLGLQRETLDCDVVEFRRLLAEGDEPSLAEAVMLYRGPFLNGFTLPDAPEFEDWVRREESQLSHSCSESLHRLASWAESREAWSTAIGYLQELIQLDPLVEAVQQRLMRLYLHRGEVGSALRQYRQFEKQLRQELDLTPSIDSQELLYDALRQQRAPATLSATLSDPSTRRPYLLPFTGRNDLLDQLDSVSQEVRSGQHGTTILIEGEAGIGKSRLLDELATRLLRGSPPYIILQGACSPFDDLRSQGPFLEALQNGLASDLTDTLTQSEASVPDARSQFSRRLLQTIRSLSSHTPVVLLIEDLQWANSSTLNLFGFLTMQFHHLGVMLVGTVQQAEAIPALQRLISLGRRRGDLRLYTLTPLGLEDVTAILFSSGISSTSVENLAEWLLARSAGSPFLLTEILAQMRAEQILQPIGASWQLDTTHWLRWRTTFTLPETTHDLVAWRLANLPPDARHLLDILAVAGQSLPEKLLRELTALQSDTFLTVLDDLALRGLIIGKPQAQVTLPHHLLRETLLHRMSHLHRRVINQQLAQGLESHVSPNDNSWLRQMAVYAVAGEDIERARRFGFRVLADMPQEYTGAETMDFVHHLYDLVAPTASVDEMVRLTRTLGTLHQSVGQLEAAAQWHEQNLAWAQKTGDSAAQTESYFEMSELALMSIDYHMAVEMAQKGLSTIEKIIPPPQVSSFSWQALLGRGHRLLGAAFAMEGSDLNAAEKHLQEAVAIHRRIGNHGDLSAVLFELGNIAAQRGELQRALGFYGESADAADAGRIHYYLALARNNFAYHSLLLGNIKQAQQSVAQGVKVAENYDLLAALLHLYSTKGEIHLYLAEWDNAEEAFKRGLAIAEELGSLERQAGYRGGLALAARGRHDFDTASRLLEEALALISDKGYWHLRTRLQISLAETLLYQERYTQAEQLLEAAIATARTHQRTLLLVQAECVRARLLARAGDWPASKALFANILKSVTSLGLALDIARVQASWGKAALEHAPSPEEGRELITTARSTLIAYQARADLATLPQIEDEIGPHFPSIDPQ